MNTWLRFIYRTPEKPLSLGTAIAVSFFLGIFGVDRYLMGYKWWWLKTITLGGLWVWYAIDLYKIAIGKLVMADGREFL
ncbi:MAG: TM2 domain-containing protein [Cytophagaceae bacterium]|jgi:hypothetical protein|nr:TM2 domain-containing protein [Cytophagaceae bacterium]